MYHKTKKVFLFITLLTIVGLYIALPKEIVPPLNFTIFGKHIQKEFELKKGLDIQGGMEVVLKADMTEIVQEDRDTAIESSREVILRRVDLFGINEPTVTTAKTATDYRLLVDLPGVSDPNQALQLVGTTAQLDFRLQNPDLATAESTTSAIAFFNQFEQTTLTGKELERALVQFDPQTNEPVIALEFNEEGKEIFAAITKENVGEVLAIFLDDYPLAMPRINTPILDGRAVMTGGFDIEEAKQTAIQLNAGALPVPIEIIEQRQLGASIGQEAVEKSIEAGLIGIGLVMAFMIMLYGWNGLIADLALMIYGILTIAIYKVMGVTLTLPGIAGMLLTIGMAVDANILIFERMKEELRLGKVWKRAMELGFGRAWDSIKDANIATIMTALVLINPLDFNFLNTSGMVRGFGITLLIGVLISLFTGVVVTRTFMRLFLRDPSLKKDKKSQKNKKRNQKK
ncbi:MAG: protein translocase subunit SecD [Candidatus Pacebacteria bacterium]|jgi:preprotein translocase subunit SecD|nr:protein translocase subunit SecD [Candidatus Paceibacterota bacterium]MBT3511644.1 protein translocase subunit SecD [Candidatus Paceibacterota bacterium]MBT4004593.1 protein translocase subunit SecD [Candidatus Paceibacterota bacterium]MBT4359160.1 protein translocase subunit SecD [Candidatus Paceibacterota bacterium]MBT4681250.1 protein translocase subunit SecD [Candidatus Paceibacterota bacterium]